MDLELAGKIAVVTGASRGIGLEVTRALIAEGATVVAGARTPGEDLPSMDSVEFVSVDLTTPEGPIALIQRAADLGGVDILVNNAGAVTPRPAGFTTVTDDDWQRTLTLTLMAPVRTTRAAIPELLRRGGGSIVTVSAVDAIRPDPLVMDYSAAKAAVTNFSKALSKEVGPLGIRVNTVSPGPVSTALWLGETGMAASVSMANNTNPADVAAAAAAESVTGRFTRPEEVAALVVMLASGRLGNVTGSDFRIDGGLVTTV